MTILVRSRSAAVAVEGQLGSLPILLLLATCSESASGFFFFFLVRLNRDYYIQQLD